MMRPLFDIHIIKKEIESGSLILTATNRLAKKIHESWAQHQIEQGIISWTKPEIFAIEHWIKETWLDCCDTAVTGIPNGAIISEEAEHLIWEGVIREEPEKPDGLMPENFSGLARDSYNIMQRWEIPLARLKDDSPLFHQWILRFQSKLKIYKFITEADSVLGLLEAYKANILAPQNRIITLGFDSMPPLYASLLKVASEKILREPALSNSVEKKQAKIVRAQFFDPHQEIRAAARWADLLQKKHPTHRIGIIIPTLTDSKRDLGRIVKEELGPSSLDCPQAKSSSSYNISTSIRLNDTPLVSSALLLLSLNFNQLPLENFCRLLNSPFWGRNSTLLTRAITEKKLRNLAQNPISNAEFINQLEFSEKSNISSDDPQKESAFCREARDLFARMSSKNSFSDWILLFQEQLAILGWPGQRDLNDAEYRQHQQWLNALERYISLDQLSLKVTLQDALRQLSQVTNKSIFQPGSPNASIQIIGLLESNALCFDHLWITGMDNDNWPANVTPYSLLPLSLQKEFMTPKSLPEKELELARNQLTRLKAASNDTVCSFSETDGSDSREASHLIANLTEINYEDISHLSLAPSAYREESLITLDKISCIKGPTINLADETILGGSGIFKHQASCPFNAFAIHRLGAKDTPTPELGLSAADRGSIIHRCMEIFWQQIITHEQLISLTEKALVELVAMSINQALKRWERARPDIFRPKFTSLEKIRLSRLLLQWLDMEKGRIPFSVFAVEQEMTGDFHGLPLKLKIDRVDQLKDGRKIIIDYKTGESPKADWEGDRLKEPQVPLYAVFSKTPIVAAVLGKIHISGQSFIGLSETSGLTPNVSATEKDLSAHIIQWEDSLKALAEEFLQGYAAVEYITKNDLRYEEYLKPLNRIDDNDMELYMELSSSEKNPDAAQKEGLES